MTQIFVAGTMYGAMTVAAAIDAGLFGGGRRVLLTANNAAIPQLATPLHEMPGFEALAGRFHEVLSWNDLIDPLHPFGWTPRAEDLPVFERLLRDRWGLGTDPVELVTESIAVSPGRALAMIFHDAPVTVYSDGLMAYGPTRTSLPNVGPRIDRLLHLDLVPGLKPRLLEEYGVPPAIVPDEAFLAVLAEVTTEVAPVLARHGSGLEGAALIVGQYLAALDLISESAEEDLHLRMLRGCAARGHTTVLFKPHPTSQTSLSGRLAEEAGKLGVRLVVIDDPVPAEVWWATAKPELVVGCFSTAQMTALRFFGATAACSGTRMMLDQLTPYQNSNRVPLVITDTLLPHLDAEGKLSTPVIDLDRAGEELAPLLTAVTYCMQAGSRPELRNDAQAFLAEHAEGPMLRYFKRRRLTSLKLPGGLSQSNRRLLTAALPPHTKRRELALKALRKTEEMRGQTDE
ncbi:alpha-2,8-polysialyltransferase family protein [Actinomadura sp. 6N118]|uniref:alpha-2,8-polysialyltransferase family protein n=1 Tax=Actinomadura sp. 6N118 TaxID=3375151 RepID=UPI0037954655